MITLNGHTANYLGLSGDSKPATAEPNAMFLELDTGDFYYYDATDGWLKVGAGA